MSTAAGVYYVVCLGAAVFTAARGYKYLVSLGLTQTRLSDLASLGFTWAHFVSHGPS